MAELPHGFVQGQCHLESHPVGSVPAKRRCSRRQGGSRFHSAERPCHRSRSRGRNPASVKITCQSVKIACQRSTGSSSACRTAFFIRQRLAARLEREHQRTAPAVLPQGHRPVPAGLRWDEAPSPPPLDPSPGVVGAGQRADDNDDGMGGGHEKGLRVEAIGHGGAIVYDPTETIRLHKTTHWPRSGRPPGS